MAGATAHCCSEKNAREKKVVSFAATAAVAAFLLSCAIGLTASASRPPDTLEQLQEKFDKEPDGVRKAKQIQKLGDAQFAKEREATKAGDFVTAGVVMEKYRDNARAALEALKKTHPDAEKHSNGYKQLEFHTGQGLREVRDVILAMPEPLRPPMQIVEKDLREIDMELLKLLFPRRPGEQPPMQPRASTPEKDAKPEKQL
jgi:hypothetical protein